MKTSNNFHQFFTGLMPEVKRLKNGAQIVSGLTAAVGIWYIVAPKLAAFHWAVKSLVALLLVALSITIIEGGLRKLAPFAIRQAVWSNFANKWWVIMFVPVMLVTMALMTSTTALSWFASPEIIEQVTPTADTTSISDIAQTYDARRADIVSMYQKQKNDAKQAANNEKQSVKAKHNEKAQNYKKRAKRSDNGKEWLLVLAGKEQDKKHDQIASINSTESEQLAKINEAQINALSALDNERAAIVTGAIASNNTLVQSVQSSVNVWGRFLAWLAAGATVLFLFCVFIEEVFSRGSVDDNETDYHQHTPPVSGNNPIGFVQAYKQTETAETVEDTSTTQETKQPKKDYAHHANYCRTYWRRYMEQPETKTGKANKVRALEHSSELEKLGYKIIVDPSDKTKIKIKPRDS